MVNAQRVPCAAPLEVFGVKPLMSCMSLALLFAQASTPIGKTEVRNTDNAVLPISGALLYNNVYGKGTIRSYRQSVFQGSAGTGWEWNWPASGGSELKVYPEILIGRSPWSDAPGLAGTTGLAAGDQLPRSVAGARQTIQFDFKTAASGLWLASFDFCITSTDHPSQKDIVSKSLYLDVEPWPQIFRRLQGTAPHPEDRRPDLRGHL